MGAKGPTSSDYEAEANRLRARIRATVGELRSNLAPSALASEAASRAGIADFSWSGAFEYMGRRHPVPTAILALGAALLAASAVRKRTQIGGVAALTSPLKDSSLALVDSATSVLRDRAEAKRQEFLAVAQRQAAAGAAKISDEIESRLERVIDRVPGGDNIRPLIESTMQIVLASALEGLLQPRRFK